jgi:hypothetical protein
MKSLLQFTPLLSTLCCLLFLAFVSVSRAAGNEVAVAKFR